MSSVFEHLDYRVFLEDWYKREKAARKGISYRSIASKVGYSSPGFFTQILQGKTNISLETADGFADLVGLKGRARDYFLALVRWNQAKEPAARAKAHARLQKFREFRIRNLESDQQSFLGSWHHAAIREVLGIRPFTGDFDGLAASLDPPISAEEARRSLDLLVALGLATRTSKGIVRRDSAISSAGAFPEEVTNRFFGELHGLGKRAMERFPRSQRSMSWVTLSISDKVREEIVEEIRGFRRRLLEIAQKDEKPTRIHQLTIMLHPLSEPLAPEKRR